MITANDCYCSAYQLSNSTITVFHWNDDSNDTLFSSYLLGPKIYKCLMKAHDYCKKNDYGKFNGHLRYIFIFLTRNKIFIQLVSYEEKSENSR